MSACALHIISICSSATMHLHSRRAHIWIYHFRSKWRHLVYCRTCSSLVVIDLSSRLRSMCGQWSLVTNNISACMCGSLIRVHPCCRPSMHGTYVRASSSLSSSHHTLPESQIRSLAWPAGTAPARRLLLGGDDIRACALDPHAQYASNGCELSYTSTGTSIRYNTYRIYGYTFYQKKKLY